MFAGSEASASMIDGTNAASPELPIVTYTVGVVLGSLDHHSGSDTGGDHNTGPMYE
jgi:hypothetical protein